MDISIIIPVYRVEKYIKGCLESIIYQTFKGNIECILVDDCGGDNSWEIVEDFVKNYSGHIIFQLIQHNTNKGVSAARNTGLKAAKGKYIYFLDSDDTITTDCLEKLSKPITDFSFDFVFSNNDYICDYKINTPFPMSDGPVYDSKSIKKYYRDGWYAVVWNKLINREFIETNNLYFEEGLIREDELWCFQMACVAKSMYVISDVTYHYNYDNPQSIMSDQLSLRHFQNFTNVLKKEIETVVRLNLNDNLHLYYQIEEAKRWRMKDAIRLLSPSDSYVYYKDLRQLRYCNSLFLPIDLKFSIKNWIRDIHYLLPSCLGFKYINFLNSLSK